ncbi:MAG: hypothetical protein NVV66_13355 [Cellulomonas sp.]|uniref:CAP domain-containing protein n=1 Tax=Cellulomonas sp. TaxID=40001 RepID=UPI00258F6123|nr:hypothetical protein [Cellulomonas sp.]MCR6705627.1 hypothetical protein [Cellulomonas sp.]
MTHTQRSTGAPDETRTPSPSRGALPTQRPARGARPATPAVPTQRPTPAQPRALVPHPRRTRPLPAEPQPAEPQRVESRHADPQQAERLHPEGRRAGGRAPRAAAYRFAPAPAPLTRRARAQRRALRVVAVAGVAALAATATGGWVAQDRAHREAVALQEARVRVDQAVAGASADVSSGARVEVATLVGERAAQVTAVEKAADAATTTLGATTHAGDEPRAALQAAIDRARATAADAHASLADLRAAAAGLAGPQKAATDAEAAWVTAEKARKAAEERARQTVRVPQTPTRGGGGSAPAPRIPAGGLRCGDTGGAGAGEASASSLGAAINSYRASLGLPTLTVSRSGSLTAHAIRMGTAGGIWHSGGDNIVGCAGSSRPVHLVQAWSHSPGHDAQMRRTDVTTMSVGAATQSGWLFGAVLFR